MLSVNIDRICCRKKLNTMKKREVTSNLNLQCTPLSHYIIETKQGRNCTYNIIILCKHFDFHVSDYIIYFYVNIVDIFLDIVRIVNYLILFYVS